MMPEIEGVFSGLIKLIFKRTKDVYETTYTDDEMRQLVSEINIIYSRMQQKHSQNVVLGTIREFMDEINRRYAIISKEEHDKYESEFGYNYTYADESKDGLTIIDIRLLQILIMLYYPVKIKMRLNA